MITEDYCSFELAKLLKEKGFNEPIRCWYDSAKDFHESGVEMRNSDCVSPTIMCPTHQMAMKWLRESHNMYYEIKLLLGEKAEKYGRLQLGIYQLNSSETYVWKDWIYADTYVELYENYIKYCLENLI